jgi:hypothetical protein
VRRDEQTRRREEEWLREQVEAAVTQRRVEETTRRFTEEVARLQRERDGEMEVARRLEIEREAVEERDRERRRRQQLEDDIARIESQRPAAQGEVVESGAVVPPSPSSPPMYQPPLISAFASITRPRALPPALTTTPPSASSPQLPVTPPLPSYTQTHYGPRTPPPPPPYNAQSDRQTIEMAIEDELGLGLELDADDVDDSDVEEPLVAPRPERVGGLTQLTLEEMQAQEAALDEEEGRSNGGGRCVIM